MTCTTPPPMVRRVEISAPETAMPSAKAETKPRILIIDDDRDFCASTTALLEHEGYAVTSVPSGKEGVASVHASAWPVSDTVQIEKEFRDWEHLREFRDAITPFLERKREAKGGAPGCLSTEYGGDRKKAARKRRRKE